MLEIIAVHKSSRFQCLFCWRDFIDFDASDKIYHFWISKSQTRFLKSFISKTANRILEEAGIVPFTWDFQECFFKLLDTAEMRWGHSEIFSSFVTSKKLLRIWVIGNHGLSRETGLSLEKRLSSLLSHSILKMKLW